MNVLIVGVVLLLAGCAAGPTMAESEREVVLQHVGVDAGTAGPFSKNGKRELEILSEGDRAKANSLLEAGAVVFLVYPKNAGPAAPGASGSAGTRVVLVQKGRVVGDFKAP